VVRVDRCPDRGCPARRASHVRAILLGTLALLSARCGEALPGDQPVYQRFIAGDPGPPIACTSREDIRRELDAAMAAKQTARVWMIAQQCYLPFLGEVAGVPDDQALLKYAQNADTVLTSSELEAEYHRFWKDLQRIFNADGTMQGSEPHLLRDQVSPAINLLQFIQGGVPNRAEALALLTHVADQLLAVQRSSGLFGAPDLRRLPTLMDSTLSHVQAVQRTQLEDHDFEEGWQTTSYQGGLQLDHGLALALLAQLHDATSDDTGKWNHAARRAEYAAAARRAGEWATAQPCVENFNYNAFSAYGLAHLGLTLREKTWRRAAVEKMKLGVFPGTIPAGHFGDLRDGRYMDPHNARNGYHWIIVRGAIATRAALEAEDPDAEVIRYYADLNLGAGVREILERGVCHTSPAHELAEHCQRFGCDASAERALTSTMFWNHEMADEPVGPYYRWRVGAGAF